ncbi:hypothetical protein SAMN02745823_03838 [Sporobacter termitidis DSM 10068]|uniref:Uncharacterized protein n=1 Tax=Sporobacter termitidis DSM 10068 TaxID=1123282 RepID=A0A1M5ZKJ0_9FIRM|nr:hypothetical protein SAMN02745823_03760 [Sporobacter termitidis DSM 10068]SHI24453.1 hypothetical protein SAMN02745823_03838 [Sporobacter termitidis DSM 10068]
MIHNHDRSGWFGASDTNIIMSNWGTITFSRWWLEKLGLRRNTFTNRAMQSGTAYEHRILDYLGVKRRDRQIKIRRYRLRVNLDGEDKIVHEVKTYSKEKFKISAAYWQQSQAEMFVTRKPLVIEAYRLMEADYANWFNPIDACRLSTHPIEYDPAWINAEYLPRLKYLAKCLKRKGWPDANRFSKI